MKATSAGHVVGKALTGYSGEGQGTVIVFIQNTYYDGIDEREYSAFTESYSGTTIDNTDPLDRFTFMVKKSLSKLDATSTATGNTTSSLTDLTFITDLISTFSGELQTIS